MYVHDFAIDEGMHTLFAVGHQKIATLSIDDEVSKPPRA